MSLAKLPELLIPLLFAVLATHAVFTGRIKLVSHMCYRAQEPRLFWMMALGAYAMGITGLLLL